AQKLVAVFFHELAPAFECETAAACWQQSEEEHRPLAQALQRARERSGQHMVALQRDFHIAAQLLESPIAHRNSEIASGNIFQCESLVKNDSASFGQAHV